MRKAAGRHPELLVEANRFHDQRIAFPLSDGCSVIAGDSFGRRPDGTSVGMDDPPVAISASVQHEDAPKFWLFDELKAIRHLKLAWTAGREASPERVILQQRPLAIFVQGSCPRLERRDLVDISEVRDKTVVIHRRLRGHVLDQHPCASCSPISFPACGRTKSYTPVWPARSRSGGRATSRL